MAALGGGRTRDIAIATQAALRAHADQHAVDVADSRRIVSDQRAEQERMHGENRSELVRVHERIDGVDAKIDRVKDDVAKLPWRIIAGMAGLLTLATTIIGYLLAHNTALFQGGH